MSSSVLVLTFSFAMDFHNTCIKLVSDMEPARYRYFVYKADLVHLVMALLIVIVFQLMALCHVLILLLFGSD